jgi:hypothetical protein
MQIITTEEIDAAVAAFNENTGFSAQAEAAGFDFCTAWPIARSVLEFLTGVPTYGWVAKIVITIGDNVAKKMNCPV